MNVVYALTCPNCDICYVGETSQKLGQRISDHRRRIEQDNGSTHVIEHFRRAHGSVVAPEVRILETMPEDATVVERRDAEARWTIALNTTFPWGLNTNIKGYGAVTAETDPAERRKCPWFQCKYERPIPRGYRERKQTGAQRQRGNSDAGTIIAVREISQMASLADKYHRLTTMRAGDINRLVEYCLAHCDEMDFKVYQELASFQLAHNAKERPSLKKPMYISFRYVNRHSNVINPDRLLRSNGILPDGVEKKDLPRVIFTKSYEPTMGSVVLNYSKFLRDLDHEKLRVLLDGRCDCGKTSMTKFMDPHHKHVTTGDTGIIDDPIVKMLIEKGSKYRQTRDDSVSSAKAECLASMQIFTHRVIRNMEEGHARIFYERVREVMEGLGERCGAYARKERLLDVQDHSLTQRGIRDLKKKFVVTPVDKAPNNFAFTCPKQYVTVLCKELGISLQNGRIITNGNDVYKLSQLREEAIIDEHARMTRMLLRKELDIENRTTPLLWAAPKFHKHPVKYRFIAGAKRASTKELSVLMAKVLYHLKEHWQRYTAVTQERQRVNMYWSVGDSGQVTQMLRRRKLPQNNVLVVADFSTLYTSFEHPIILEHATAVVRKMFANAGHKYISVGRKGYYHSSETRGGVKLTEMDVIGLVQYMVTNSYVKFAGDIFHQKSGIPMGANYSPVLADLCLSHIEFSYIRAHPDNARRLGLTTRYIDDLLSVGSRALQELAPDIYPSSLPLSFDDTTNGTAHYLDLLIDRNLKTIGLFDKRKDFSFTVVRFTDACSNVPRSMPLNVLFSQTIRIARICTQKTEFTKNVKDLAEVMRQKGFSNVEIERTINKARKKYPALFIRHKIVSKRDAELLVR